MAVLLAGLAWAGLIGWLIRRASRQFAAYRASSLRRLAPAALPENPDVAIIVPARNEIANIADCLASLTAQHGLRRPGSIIVVDDGSVDGTAEAAARLATADQRITLVEAGPLPAGWMGKPHACWRGAGKADAQWLCFVDADVRLAPPLIRLAVGAAEHHCIDMLSVSPFQVLGSFWERLIIPAGLIALACARDLRRINDPGSSEASANGQILLVRRSAYFAIGGHAAVRSEVCEDKALAALMKRAGRRFMIADGEDLARTRMYKGLAGLWEGLAKNATELIGSGAGTVAVAIAAMAVAGLALMIPALAVIAALRSPSPMSAVGAALALAGSLAVTGIHIGTARHFRIPAFFGLLFPAAYIAVAVLAWHSAALRRAGRVRWKGRTYRVPRPNAARGSKVAAATPAQQAPPDRCATRRRHRAADRVRRESWRS